jgi:peptidoglycan-associated lipoprotein
MHNSRFNSLAHIAVLTALALLTACGTKKTAKVTPAVTAPPPVAPTASLSASPEIIQQGQSTVLKWQTTDANDITIDGLGTVASSGSHSVTPAASRSYTLVAKGPGGTSESTARITVNPVVAHAQPVQENEGDLFARNIKDVFFNFDDARLRSDAAPAAQNDARFLSQHPDIKVLVEGHCDDRGSELYNLALGVKRANTVRDTLIQQGIDPSRIKTISYGKEKPFCSEENEECWQQNRRDHVVPQH